MKQDSAAVKNCIGKLLIAGFEGYELTEDSQASKLIRNHRVHAFILGHKNFKDAPQLKRLIHSLQELALKEGYDYPLLLAVDQELGCCNSLYDPEWITQFPGAMGMAATDDVELIYKIGEAVGRELTAIGFNLYMGPVLDIVPRMASNQIIGVRAFGSTIEDVTKYAGAYARGLRQGGILICAKHFPGMGSSFVDNLLELPMMLDTLPQLEAKNIVPFENLMNEGLVDAVHAGGVAVPNIAPDEIHACLSPKVVYWLLREKAHFQGLVISECLELEALCRNIGLGQGVIMSILYARCDMVMVCNDYSYQQEALESLEKAYHSGDHELVFSECVRRIDRVLSQLSWHPQEGLMTPDILNEHRLLSVRAYHESLTLVRDNQEALPISKYFSAGEENNVLLLTPLLTEIHWSAHHSHPNNAHAPQYLPGENIFQEFGSQLANYKPELDYHVLHTSYTANGLTNMHEDLIEKSRAVVLVCADAGRNMYQIGVAKHVNLLCGGYMRTNGFIKKPLIIVAVTSPYDFLYHQGIGSTYLCTYDYTFHALADVPAVLFGDMQPTGHVPSIPRGSETQEPPSRGSETVEGQEMALKGSVGMLSYENGDAAEDEAKKMTRMVSPAELSEDQGDRRRRSLNKPWLVEPFDVKRDFSNLVFLLRNSWTVESQNQLTPRVIEAAKFLLERPSTTQHFVVRNSTMNVLNGVVFTQIDRDGVSGRILYIIVDKGKRRQSIAESLHQHAVKYLTISRGCKTITLGGDFPLMELPNKAILDEVVDNWALLSKSALAKSAKPISTAALRILGFLRSTDWATSRKPDARTEPLKKYVLTLSMDRWLVSERLVKQLKVLGIRFEIASDHAEILSLIRKNHFAPDDEEARLLELYTVASECIAEEKTLKKPEGSANNNNNNNNNNNTLIFQMVGVESKTLIGAIIVYNMKSKLTNWFPVVDSDGGDKAPDSCLVGAFVDSNYESLKAVLRLGLVCMGVSFLKHFKAKSVAFIGCNQQQLKELTDSGFQVFGEYVSSVATKMSYEWVV